MKCRAVAALVGISCTFFTFQTSAASQSRNATIAQINAYAAEIDRYIQRNPRAERMFGDTAEYDDSNPRWREFKTKAAFEKATLYQSATVWTRAGTVVLVGFTFTSPSGDWAHFINYYFRDDGSLAKIEGQLNTFYGDVSIVRKQHFNDAGIQISSTERFLDLKTRKPIKKPDDFFDKPVPVYRTITELPFHKLL
jgi:hypothetical protein